MVDVSTEGDDAHDVGPAAQGARLPFADLPQHVRDAIAALGGGPIAAAEDQAGGFSPGVASRLTLEDGRRVFVKAVSPDPNPWSVDAHRQEADITARLPVATPAPRLLGTIEVDGWVVLALEDIDGRQPALPWDSDVLREVIDAIDQVAATCTPSPVELQPTYEVFGDEHGVWTILADEPGAVDGLEPWLGEDLTAWVGAELATLVELTAPWREALTGDTLIHGDVRADNLLLTDDGVVLVDWPWASVGAPVFELVAFLPSVAMQSDLDPEEVLRWSTSGRAAPAAQVDTLVALVAAYFVAHGRQPPPPGLPTVRAFQQAQAREALAWLRRRLATG